MIAVSVGVAISVAAMTATEAIKQRQKAMEGVRDGMMALGAIAKKEQPFDADVVRANATKIADHLEQAAELFPAGSDNGRGRDLGQAGDLDRPRSISTRSSRARARRRSTCSQ